MGLYSKLNEVRLVEKSITIADLTAAATSQAIDFDAASDADDYVVGAYVEVTAVFTGGGASSCTVDLGIKTRDADGFIDGANVFAATGTKSDPRGVIIPTHADGGTFQMTIESDVNVNTLTTGALKATVMVLNTKKA